MHYVWYKKSLDEDINILSKLGSIEELLNKILENIQPYKEDWIDSFEVMRKLKISPRTLQTYRKENIIPYTQLKGIYYYKNSDINLLLEKWYIKRG